MSDIIWHYCCLMGGVSAASASGIRTSTAGAVCLDLNSQLLLLQCSPPTLADNLDSSARGRTAEWNSSTEFWEEDMGPELFLLLLLFRVRWGHEWGGLRGGGGQWWGFSRQRARRLTDCPLRDDGLTYPFAGQLRTRLFSVYLAAWKTS